MRFEGKSVVVTGAASGMGRQITLDFAREGATVIGVDIKESELVSVVLEAEGLPGRVLAYPGDLALQETNEGMIDYAVEQTGKLDILVNNAGVGGRFEPVGDLTNELWERVMKIDLQAPMFSIRKAVQVMSKQETGGSIVSTASVCAIRGCRSGVAYTVAKHGLIGLTENTAYMYLEQGIRCNVVCPGGIKTSLIEDFPDDNPFGKARVASGSGQFSPRLLGEPVDVSSVIRYLSSDEAKFINGATIVIDGGLASF